MDLPILQMVSLKKKVAIATGKPFAASQAAQVPWGAGEILSQCRAFKRLENLSRVWVFEYLSLVTSAATGK
jgi:hypothetical protein